MNSKFDAEKADKLIRLAAQSPNMSIADLGLAVGISRRTLQAWLRRGLEAKSGKFFEIVEAINKSRAQLRTFVAGRHHVLAVGGTLQTPKKKVLLDDHQRPYPDPNGEVERRWSGGDPKCDHADHDLGQCPCGAIGEIVYIETAVLPNAGNLQWEMERLMPEQNPAQHVQHNVSGRVKIDHYANISTDEWLKRLAGGYQILQEANLDPATMDRTLIGLANTLPGVQPKQVNEVKAALKRLAAPVETVATVIPDKTDFVIEMSETEDGTGDVWEKIGDQTASSPETACRGFLVAYCHGRLADKDMTAEKKREFAAKMVTKFLPRVRAVPKTEIPG